MQAAPDNMLYKSLQAEADEICTPDIRDRMWSKIFSRIKSIKKKKENPTG